MKEITLDCKAKINLSIDVLRKRPDGYHDVKMIMLAVNLCDTVGVKLTSDNKTAVFCSDKTVPAGADNLAAKAAKAFFDRLGKDGGAEITIEKRIPMGAGMAGGSADAAGVLRALNIIFGNPFSKDELMAIGKSLGADIPFCIFGGCALAEGIGEKLTSLPEPPPMHYVIAKPPESVSTKWVYEHLDLSARPKNFSVAKTAEGIKNGDIKQIADFAGNILETVTVPAYPVIGEYKHQMRELGAVLTLMSGSGSAVFGMFSDREKAGRAFGHFQKFTKEVYIV